MEPPPPAPPPPPLFCGSCGAAVDRLSMLRCGSCARVEYCGRACADAHWAAHRAACEEATAARVRSGDGDLEGADRTPRNAVKRARKELGREHAETLVCQDTYATYLRRAGRYEEANALFRQTLELRRRTLGDSHPDTLASISHLALLLQAQGKWSRRSRWPARRWMGIGARWATPTPPR